MKYTPVGVDIAKHLIQVHFIDEHTGEVVDKQLRSKDFLTFFSNQKTCLIGMEAVVTMGEASAFKSGREFAAYVGLVPKQTGSEEKCDCWG